MKFAVRVSDSFLDAMTLSAVEAYCMGDGRKGKSDQLETFGYVWGFKKETEGGSVFFLERLSLSLSAKRTSGSVTPNREAAKLKNEIVARWAPHLTMLGHFHSHPYRNFSEVKAIRGYDFSPDDFDLLRYDDFFWESSGNTPIMIAITVCKLDRVHDTLDLKYLRDNVCQYDVGEFRFWINISVGFLQDGARNVTGNTHSKAAWDLVPRFYNSYGDRVRSTA